MVTFFTNRLAGATLDGLLEAAGRDTWPDNTCDHEWDLLRNWAIQTESLMVDEAENLAWAAAMRELSKGDPPYLEWVARRGELLEQRVRARKLAQTRLRYKYGFKQPRRWGLISSDVRALYAEWSG